MSLNNNSPNTPAVPATATPPVNVEEMFTVKGSQVSDPLAFIKANVRAPEQKAPEVLTPPAPVPQAAAPEVKVEPVTQPAAPISVEDEFPDLDPRNPQEVNFKKMRGTLKAEREEKRALQEAIAARETELEDYKTGRKLSDTLQAKEDEVAKLRVYEKIVSLKTSPEYHEKYVAPLTEVKGKVEKLFAEYQLPKEVLAEARSLKSVAKLNGFLSDHFDSTGALEVKGLLERERGIVTAMQEADKEPAKVLETLIQEGQQAKATRQRAEREQVQHTFREGWVGTLEKIKKEGVFSELIHKPGDSNFNTNVVDPLVRNAATEAGKFLTMLVEDGLTKVRPEVAEFISRMSLLVHSSAVNATTRSAAVAHIRELEQNTTRMNNIARPQIGGSTGASPGASAPREPMRPDTMGAAILQKIGVK